ncbi:hypothetical protein J4X36_17545, partial [Escherichia coli]
MDKKTINTNRYYLSGNLQNVLDSKQIICYCINMGLPRSWWEGSERHIQLSVVEHHPQFKALPVSVSPGFYPQQPD